MLQTAMAALNATSAWVPPAAQELWSGVFHEYTHAQLYFGGLTLFSVVPYWTFSIAYLVLDFTQWPAFLHKYKVQPDKNAPLDKGKFMNALRLVLFNMFVVNTALSVIGYWANPNAFRIVEQLPAVREVLLHLAIFVAVEEVLFYYSHRLVHNKFLYQYIHKIHHQWTAPIGMVATYAHPLEHIVSNVGPVLAGPVLCNAHIVTVYLWIVLALFSTITSHSGYHLPLMPSPQFHDFHHLKFNYCFGVLGILDRLHNTDSLFRESPQSVNNRVHFGEPPVPFAEAKKSTKSAKDE